DERRADLLEIPRLEACGRGVCGGRVHVLVELRAAALTDAHALAAAALDAHARGLAFGVEEHHVGDVDRALGVDHAAELTLGAGGDAAACGGARAHVPFGHVPSLDVSAFPRVLDAGHTPGFSP